MQLTLFPSTSPTAEVSARHSHSHPDTPRPEQSRRSTRSSFPADPGRSQFAIARARDSLTSGETGPIPRGSPGLCWLSSSRFNCFSAYASAAVLNQSGRASAGRPLKISSSCKSSWSTDSMTPSSIQRSAIPSEPSEIPAAFFASAGGMPRDCNSRATVAGEIGRSEPSGIGCARWAGSGRSGR
jgi:hypothetical protein